MNPKLHARILGGLHLLIAIAVLGSGAFFVFIGVTVGRESALLIFFPGAILLALGLPFLIAGIGLLRRRKWAFGIARFMTILLLFAAFDGSRYWITGLVEGVFPGTDERALATVYSICMVVLAAYHAFVVWLQNRSASPLSRA